MPLITCPGCGTQISDAATACTGCGCPMTPAAVDAPARAASVAPVTSPCCPTCSSTNLRKFSLLHEDDLLPVVTALRGGNDGTIEPGDTGDAVDVATSVSDLARRVAPPIRRAAISGDQAVRSVLFAAFVGTLASYAGGFWWALIVFVVVLAVNAAVIRAGALEADERYPKALDEWYQKYLCMQCGTAMTITHDEGAPRVTKIETDPQLDALIRAGQKIAAVRYVRDTTGLGLADAKARVDSREFELL